MRAPASKAAAALTSAGLLFGLLAAASPSVPIAGGVSIGDEVTYDFRETPLNGLGVNSMADLAGKPVIVEFWGTR